jgi:hypothetical protein
MLAPMACLVVVTAYLSALPCTLSHPEPQARLPASPRPARVTCRGARERSSTLAGSCPEPIVVDIPRGRRDAKEGVSRGG